MSSQTLYSMDLEALSKRDLKAIASAIREETGKPIDLRANCETLRQYIEDHRNSITPPLLAQLEESTTQPAEVEEATSEVELTVPNFEKNTTVNVTAENVNQIAPEFTITMFAAECYSDKSCVFSALFRMLQDNRALLTTEGLSRLLDEYSLLMLGKAEPQLYPSLKSPSILLGLAGFELQHQDILRRIAADPTGWGQSDYYARMGKILSAQSVEEIMLYHSTRDIIQELQIFADISGLRAESKMIRGNIVSYLDKNDQLALNDGDKDKLKTSVVRTAEQFINIVKQPPPQYKLARVENEEEYPTTYAQIAEYSAKAQYAWIHAQSLDWEPVAPGQWQGKTAQRPDPDEITLHLAMSWDGDEPEDYIVFEAKHSDNARFPWMN